MEEETEGTGLVELARQYRQAKADHATHTANLVVIQNQLTSETAKASAAWDHADMVKKALLAKLDETQ